MERDGQPTLDHDFDVIIANPPWMIASPIPESIDSGNYDQNEVVLQKIFEFVENKLEPTNGVFYLVYSDLSQILGLQEAGRIEKLANQVGLFVTNVTR